VATERRELELGFDGGVVVRVAVAAPEADELERAYRDGDTGLASARTEAGELLVDLRKLVYVRAIGRRLPIGFGSD
jgi:hypothetical protein